MKASHNGWVLEGSPQELAEVISSGLARTMERQAKIGAKNPARAVPVVRRRKGQKRRWTDAEIRAVKEGLRQGVTVKKIARSLGRTYWSVTRAVQRINSGDLQTVPSSRALTRRSGVEKTWKKWTSQDEAYLRANWHGGRNVPALVQQTGRTALAIRVRAYKLGLPDPFHFPAKDGSGSATNLADT